MKTQQNRELIIDENKSQWYALFLRAMSQAAALARIFGECREGQKAQVLMRGQSRSLKTVAKMVGFKDYFYFNKIFKKMEGISPSKFRKEL